MCYLIDEIFLDYNWIMQAEQSFIITIKHTDNPNNNAVAPFTEVTISIQKEASAAITHRGVIGKSQFNANLQAILLQMHQGDKWSIQSHDKISYLIEVVEVGKTVDSRSRLVIGESLKAEGNGLIKQKENKKAIQKYQQAYNLVVNDPSNQAYQLKISLISNLALASLNLSEFKTAINWCNQHLEETLQPNLKVIYRKATANKGLKNWAEAKRDIAFGIENSEGDVQSLDNFKKLLLQVQKQEKEQQKKEKAVYGKMFG